MEIARRVGSPAVVGWIVAALTVMAVQACSSGDGQRSSSGEGGHASSSASGAASGGAAAGGSASQSAGAGGLDAQAPDDADASTQDAAVPVEAGLTQGTLSLRSFGYMTGSPCEYGEYLPKGYSPQGNFPFLIFQHGIGQIGGSLSDAVYTTGGPMYELQQGTIQMDQIPMVVLEPHVNGPSECQFDTADAMPNFVNAAIAFYGLDPKRFYITGLSEGGAGTNAYLNGYYSVTGAPVPAAAVPLAAAGEFNNGATAGHVIQDKIAVWGGDSINDSAFQYGSAITTDVFNELASPSCGQFLLSTYPFPGTSGTTPYTCYCDTTQHKYVWVQGMVTQLNGTDIAPPYLLTLWPGNAHSASWSPMYSNPDMYRWLLAHPRT